MLAGASTTVRWTVTNAGNARAAGTWSDRIYLTRTGTLSGAILVGTVTTGRNLDAGAHYDASVEITLPSVADELRCRLAAASMTSPSTALAVGIPPAPLP